MGPLNLPSSVPYHASQMYGSNVTAFVKLLFKDGALNINLDDEIIRETLVTYQDQSRAPARSRTCTEPIRSIRSKVNTHE